LSSRRAVRDTTLGRISLETGEIFLGEMKITDDHFRSATQVNIAACGTSCIPRWPAST